MRILVINDLSCMGRGSLMTFIPVLSALGHQAVPLPTALLSSQTGGVSDYVYFPLHNECVAIAENWAKKGQKFDMLVTGYLPDSQCVAVAKFCIENLLNEGGKIIVDPVMGDNGEPYQGVDPNLRDPMRALLERADIIIPNYTEGCILTDESYGQNPSPLLLLKKLRAYAPTVILTGVNDGSNVLTYADDGKGVTVLSSPMIPCMAHGAGDLFCATLVGCLANSFKFERSLNLAHEFTFKCIQNLNGQGEDTTFGIKFEQNLSELYGQIKAKS